MSLIINTLRSSPITAELSDAEIEILAGIAEVKDLKAGDSLVAPGDSHESLLILAHGNIEVSVQSGEEQVTLHVLKPGDLAGVIGFVGGSANQVSASLHAMGDVRVLSLDRKRFEALVASHPTIVYRVMCGLVRNVHGIVRRMNVQSVELSNYIFRHHGRY